TIAPVTLGQLEVIGSTLTTTANVSVTGLVNWSVGNLNGSGTLTAQGGLSISGNNATSGLNIINTGIATWASGTVRFYGTASLTNASTGTFNDQIDGSFGSGDNCCQVFNNQGTFIKSGGTGTTNLELQLNNSGTVLIEEGTLNLGCGYVQGSGGSI